MVTPEDMPPDYLAEQVRTAIAQEAHDLGIKVTLTPGSAVLEGCVETSGQRDSIESIARRLLAVPAIDNRITVVDPTGRVKKESLP
jgi:osmotically-inducible protein OsmY